MPAQQYVDVGGFDSLVDSSLQKGGLGLPKPLSGGRNIIQILFQNYLHILGPKELFLGIMCEELRTVTQEHN